MTIIDAHQHIWDLARADYNWLGPDMPPINRTVSFAEVEEHHRRAGVSGVVLVQAADNDEDTDNMLDAAAIHSEILGVVAWVPLERPQRTADRLAELADSPVVGIRTLLHNRADTSWVLRDNVDEGLSLLETRGVPFDYVTGSPAALAHLPTISERHPSLRLVIDHLGKPPVGGNRASRTEWRRLLGQAAANPLVFAKVSGLYPGTGDASDWTAADIRPVVEEALEIFGPERLMYGSDWPVSELAGGYDRTWDAMSEMFAALGERDRARVLAGTAADFYRLPQQDGAAR